MIMAKLILATVSLFLVPVSTLVVPSSQDAANGPDDARWNLVSGLQATTLYIVSNL